MRVRVEWETDGYNVACLPTEVLIPSGVTDVSGWLSDEYGWLVSNWQAISG